jgi:hypothetical protein
MAKEVTTFSSGSKWIGEDLTALSHNGGKALSMFAIESFDLVVTDAEFPNWRVSPPRERPASSESKLVFTFP